MVLEGAARRPDRCSYARSAHQDDAEAKDTHVQGPGTIMHEMGHTDPGLALRVYRQAMRRGEDERAALRALVEGSELTETAEAQEGSSIAG